MRRMPDVPDIPCRVPNGSVPHTATVVRSDRLFVFGALRRNRFAWPAPCALHAASAGPRPARDGCVRARHRPISHIITARMRAHTLNFSLGTPLVL